jgi:hypothetical protein
MTPDGLISGAVLCAKNAQELTPCQVRTHVRVFSFQIAVAPYFQKSTSGEDTLY